MEAALRYETIGENLFRILPSGGETKQTRARAEREHKSSEVFAYEGSDAHRMLQYMRDHEMWLHYLMFVAQMSIARRNGDMLSLRWKNFYNPDSGDFRRDMLEICEEKTGKFAAPRIGEALKDAIRLYIEKTGCDPSENNYENYVFLQLSGTRKGRVVSYEGCLKALKRVAKEVGIDYNVGTHSARKSFGATVLKLHPQDPRALEMTSGFLNHSNTRVTEAYTGRTKASVDKMVDEVSDYVSRYVVNGEEYAMEASSPVVSIKSEDLRQLLQAAYNAGRENAANDDPMSHIEAFASLMAMAEEKITK